MVAIVQKILFKKMLMFGSGKLGRFTKLEPAKS